jgi:GTP-binding protein Era
MTDSRAAFVAVLGATNAGKSTLVNQLVGRKVAITSHKVQTTRNRIKGIFEAGDTQIVLIDTPGIFTPRRELDEAMLRSAWRALEGADEILLLIDAVRGLKPDVAAIVQKLQERGLACLAALNKVDALPKEKLLPLAARLAEYGIFKEIFMISATEGIGVAELREYLVRAAPAAPWYFPAGQRSDIHRAFEAAEITREKVYKFVHQELPYQIYVATEKVETAEDGVLEIWQKIAVATEGHKKIVVGRGGEMLKKIGTAARHEIQDEWGVNARLHLFVRVEKDWENKKESYEEQGLEFKN